MHIPFYFYLSLLCVNYTLTIKLSQNMKIQITILKSLFFVTILCFSIACGPQGSNSTSVEAEDPQTIATQAATDISYQILPESSYVSWIGSKALDKHNGVFPIQSGEFFLNTEGISSGSTVIDIANIKVEDLEGEEAQKLSAHLLSADFFDAQQYPVATFEIVAATPFDATAFEDTEEYDSPNKPAKASEFRVENPTHNITGNLTIRGTSKSITFPAQVVSKGDSVSVKAKFNMNRQDWGIAYGDESSVVDKTKDKFIYNTVNVGFELYAVRSLEEATNQSQSQEAQQSNIQ